MYISLFFLGASGGHSRCLRHTEGAEGRRTQSHRREVRDAVCRRRRQRLTSDDVSRV